MKKRLLSALLILTMLASVLVGCAQEPETTTVPTEDSQKPNPEENQNLLKLIDGGESQYKIVYPMKDKVAEEQARLLAEEISSKLGVDLKVVHDSQGKADEYEIRVGNVKGARLEVLEVYKAFGKIGELDFAVKTVGNTVYVYGTGMQGTVAGMTYFLNKAASLNAATKTFGVPKALETIYHKNETPAVAVTGTDDHYVYFSLDAGTLQETFCRLSYTGNNGWRVQTKRTAAEEFDNVGAAQRLAFFLGEQDPSGLVKILTEKSGDLLTVKTADAADGCVKINQKNFRMDFYTKSGKLAGTVNDLFANAGGSFIKGELTKDEKIFGTGERFNTSNQRGNKLEMISRDIWSSDTSNYVAIPLLCSSRGSGIFLNRYEYMTVDLDSKGTNVWSASIEEANVDCYLFTTEQISEVLYGYSSLTGFAEAPEEWSYGMLICRFSPDLSQKWSADVTWNDERGYPDADSTIDGRGFGVYDVIAKMEAYDLPWSGILAEPWGSYAEAKHEDLKELCDYVHSLGKKFLVYIAVGNASSKMSGFSNNYLVSRTLPNGTVEFALPDTQDVYNNPDNPEGIRRNYLDITNPEAVEWFFNVYWKKLSTEIGVDGCKIDFCELMPENYELNYYDQSMPTEGSHHWYPSAFCAMFWDMISDKPDSGMCYIRGGGIGLQRSPYVWAGDQKRVFQSLDLQLTAMLSSGLSGLPFISYDMSGYEYGGGRAAVGNGWELHTLYRSLAYESQVFIRGLQFSAFTICMQTHGTVRMVYEFAEEGDLIYDKNNKDEHGSYIPKTDAAGNYVYDYIRDMDGNPVLDASGKPVVAKPGTYAHVVDIYRAYVKLHELLTPYITEYSNIACETGMPLMRHLVLHYQDDEKVYGIDDEYLFGDAFLVAPITDEGYTREVYLPQGVWKDLNTGEVYTVGEGGETIQCTVGLTQIPVFYNLNTTSETAEDLLDGIEEIFDHLKEIEAKIPNYIKNAL